MRESTAAIVASVVETTRDQVLLHQQHFLDHERIFLDQTCTGLVKHVHYTLDASQTEWYLRYVILLIENK